VIGGNAAVPMKTPLARGVIFSRGGQRTPARISEPAAPPFPLFPRYTMHGAQKETSDSFLLSESWNRCPSGAAKYWRKCGTGRPSVLGFGRALRWCAKFVAAG